jgi:hypothetical protein
MKNFETVCKAITINLPVWYDESVHKQTVEILVEKGKLYACKFLCDLSTENGTRFEHDSGTPKFFGLAKAKALCDFIDNTWDGVDYVKYLHIPTGKEYRGNGAGGLLRVDNSTNASLPIWLVENSKDWLKV